MIHYALPPEDPDDPALDREFPLGDGTVETTTAVLCPYCGAEVEVVLDPGGGRLQRYVEDCEICCRPWRLTVTWDEEGNVAVRAETEDG